MDNLGEIYNAVFCIADGRDWSEAFLTLQDMSGLSWLIVCEDILDTVYAASSPARSQIFDLSVL